MTKSVMEMLFDTMALAGVKGAFGPLKGQPPLVTWPQAMLSDVAKHMECLQSWKDARAKAPKLAFPKAQKDYTPLWSYKQSQSSPATFEEINCRPRIMDFADFRVLDKLEFGSAKITDPHEVSTPQEFKQEVSVTIDKFVYDLPLDEAHWLATFKTKNGRNEPGSNSRWPIRAFHDVSTVHVFAYDIDTTAIFSKFDPIPADRAKGFRDRFREEILRESTETRAESYLFKDELWDTSTLPSPPTATVPEDVTVTAHVVRVLIACCLTVCRESADFFPGDAIDVARLFPHVMVAATRALNYIEAGVRLTRPATTKQIPEAGGETPMHDMSMDGMLSKIGGLLVADSNAANMTLYSSQGPPTIWANLFNYYQTNPATDPAFSAYVGKAMPIVYEDSYATKGTLPRANSGSIDRDCSDIAAGGVAGALAGVLASLGIQPITQLSQNRSTVLKLPRQGWFDNLHLAPKMTLPSSLHIDHASIVAAPTGGSTGGPIPFTSAAAWKMDALTMAPFCAHDCFHMHWRWSSNQNEDPAAHGFGGTANQTPNSVAGSPLIPGNHSAHLVINSETQVTYLGQAHAPTGVWEIFCHHGCGYGVDAEIKAYLVIMPGMREVAGTRFWKGPSESLPTDQVDRSDWALFYWVNRYCFSSTSGTITERFKFLSTSGLQTVLEL